MKGQDKSEVNSDQGLFGQVIAIPAFRSLWFGQICSQLAINTLLFVLALRVYQTTSSNTAVSILFLVYGVPAVLFGMAAGAVVDKLDKRWVLLVCDIVRAILIGGFLFLSHNIFAIYTLTFFHALLTQLYVPAEAPTIPQLVPSRLLVAANSLFSFTYFSSLAVGSIFAGPFLRIFGSQGIFFFLSFLFFAAALNVSRIPKQEKTSTIWMRVRSMSFFHILERVFANLTEGIAYVRSHVVLRDALLLLTGTQVILALLGTLGPGFADRVLGIDVRDVSLIITGPAVLGIILGALWVGFAGSKISATKLIHRGILGAGILLMLISLTVRLSDLPSFDWLFRKEIILPIELVLFFFLGVANSLLDVPANSILQKEAEGEMRGRVYGMLTAAVGGIGILPVVLGGVFADAVGVGRVIFFLGLIITVYGFYRIRYNTI